MSVMAFVDTCLLLGLTLRLSRLITGDHVGLWFVRGPASMWAQRHEPNGDGWRAKLQLGLDCPFCIGFWLGGLALLSLWLAGGPGDAAAWWRWSAGLFALNWAVGHIAGRMGDVD